MSRAFGAVAVLLLAGCGDGLSQDDIDVAVAEALAEQTTTAAPTTTMVPATTTTPGMTPECAEAIGSVVALDDIWGQQAAKFDAAIERSDLDAAEHWHRDLLETFDRIDGGHSSIEVSCPAYEVGVARAARDSYRAIRRDLQAACQALNTSGLTAWQCR